MDEIRVVEDEGGARRGDYYYDGSELSEIEEGEEEGEDDSSDLFEIKGGVGGVVVPQEVTGGSLFSFDFEKWKDDNNDVVYVKIGKQEKISMDALLWTLSHAIHPHSIDKTLVFLIFVFPEIKHIPTLLGMLPIEQANPLQQEAYLALERGKRTQYVHKFVDVCSASKVKAESIMIESDKEAKAVLDLIPILNIRRLVIGTKRRNIRSRRVSGTAGQLLKGGPHYCEVKIICEGKQVTDLVDADSVSSRRSSRVSPTSSPEERLSQILVTRSKWSFLLDLPTSSPEERLSQVVVTRSKWSFLLLLGRKNRNQRNHSQHLRG